MKSLSLEMLAEEERAVAVTVTVGQPCDDRVDAKASTGSSERDVLTRSVDCLSAIDSS